MGLAMWSEVVGYLRPRCGGSPLGRFCMRDRGGSVNRRLFLGALAAIAVILALVAAGCGGSKKSSSSTTGGGGSSGGNASALPASSCSPIYYQGSGKPELIFASDLPLQGSGRTQTV